MSSLVYAAALAFAVGYAPALAAYATGGGSPPIARTDLAGLSAAVSPFVRQILPIVIGLRSPRPAGCACLSGSGCRSCSRSSRRSSRSGSGRSRRCFISCSFTTPLIFLLSGAFVDAQSYRYLMPVSGALAVVLALGVWRIFRWSRVAGAVSLAMILTLFGLEQRAWYRGARPDTQSAAIINCLDRTACGPPLPTIGSATS